MLYLLALLLPRLELRRDHCRPPLLLGCLAERLVEVWQRSQLCHQNASLLLWHREVSPCFRCHLCRLLLLGLPLVLLSFCCMHRGLLGGLAEHRAEDWEVPALLLLLPWLRLRSWMKLRCLWMCRWCRLPAVQPLLQVSLVCWILPWSSCPLDLLLCSCCRWCLLLPKVHSGFGRLLWSCPLWIPARQDVVQHRLRSWRCCRADGLTSCFP